MKVITEFLAKVLNKNKISSVVIIDEISTDDYDLSEESITELRKK